MMVTDVFITLSEMVVEALFSLIWWVKIIYNTVAAMCKIENMLKWQLSSSGY